MCWEQAKLITPAQCWYCTTPAELLPVGLGSQGLEVPWEMDLSGVSWITTVFFGAELDKRGVGGKLCECGGAWPWVDGFSWNIWVKRFTSCSASKKKKILESWLLIYQLLKLEKVFLQWSGVEVSLAASQPLQRRWLCQQWICLGESL